MRFQSSNNQLAMRASRCTTRLQRGLRGWLNECTCMCVCMSVERAWGVRRNLYSRFGRLSCVLQAWWLCAAMRLCYHTIEHLYVHIPSPHFFLSLFFFFSFILNPRSRFGDNQSEGDQGLDAPFRIMWSSETLTAKLHGR